MKLSTRVILIIIVIALLPGVVKLQALIDPQRKQFQPGRGVAAVISSTDGDSNPTVLPSQFIAGTLIGLQEVVAGLLWIRADDFFHTGNYQAIIPLMRIITWLDPHQIDVYRVGAWHLTYNMVDSAERADYRFIAPSVKFLEEGIDNNPGVSDLEFDLGFLIYGNKAENFEKATYWIRRACEEKDAILPMHRQIAHSLEKQGKIDEAVAEWRTCLKEGEAACAKDNQDYRALDHKLVSERNLNLMLIRKTMRRDVAQHRFDVGFEAKFKRLGPRKFEIAGVANLPAGARIDVMLQDADYKEPKLKSFRWDTDPNVTVLADTGMHGIFVENKKFSRRFDLTRDVKQYPFKKDKYVLVLSWNPRTTADFIQDNAGWSGEGITDKKYLDTSVPGLRKVRKVIYLKREDLI